MSLVGPRPNVQRETDLYTAEEKKLLTVRPGITDFASIVFSDEGEILAGKADPDIAYNQLIRPGKSRLGLFYVQHANPWLDLQLISLTAIAITSKPSALRGVARILQRLGAPADLTAIARRDRPLEAAPPPGATQIVTNRSSAAV
jgi:lipopolysaccharide/colanic/teichoic acid biosynthesis glycosyltransferase